MQYTKPMIELVYEIRRLAPSELKPGIKLANPALFDELRTYFKIDAKTIQKALIRELFLLADEDLRESSEASSSTETKSEKQVKAYRGAISLEKKPERQEETKSASNSKTRIYRGQIVTA